MALKYSLQLGERLGWRKHSVRETPRTLFELQSVIIVRQDLQHTPRVVLPICGQAEGMPGTLLKAISPCLVHHDRTPSRQSLDGLDLKTRTVNLRVDDNVGLLVSHSKLFVGQITENLYPRI